TLLFEVVRYDPKDFRQRRPDGKGGWTWGLDDTRRVLYRLPNVVAAVARGETIYLVEGEKDVHALEALGLVAACSPGGAGKWRPEYTEVLRGADVVLIGDNDEAGRNHLALVTAALAGVARRLRVLDLAAVWPECGVKDDVSDWFAVPGHTAG